MKKIHPVRLALKTLLIFIIANLLFAWFDPPIARISLYNHLFPGRTRFPYGLGARTTTISELDALFASHEIAAPKADDEYRVVILGDSSVWGDGLEHDQTAFLHLNEYALTCNGKNVKFYNLGYPHLAAIKDMIILDRAMDFDPDAVIWSFTLRTLLPKLPNQFLKDNAPYVRALPGKYTLPLYPYADLNYEPPTFWQKTIVGKRVDLAWLLKLQVLGGAWTALGNDAGTNYRAPDEALPQPERDPNDLDADLSYRQFDAPSADLVPGLWSGYLDTAEEISGETPILYVNQPMFIATGENSDLHYNADYPRWAYDQYRDFLLNDMAVNDRNLLDIWDSIDARHFTGASFHLSPEGERIKAELYRDAFQAQICGE